MASSHCPVDVPRGGLSDALVDLLEQLARELVVDLAAVLGGDLGSLLGEGAHACLGRQLVLVRLVVRVVGVLGDGSDGHLKERPAVTRRLHGGYTAFFWIAGGGYTP